MLRDLKRGKSVYMRGGREEWAERERVPPELEEEYGTMHGWGVFRRCVVYSNTKVRDGYI